MQDDTLKELQDIKDAWLKKRNAFRLEEAKTSDANILFSLRTQIEAATKKIEEVDADIENLLSKQNEIILSNKVVEEKSNRSINISKAYEVFQQQKQDLGFNTTKEDVAKLVDLKLKIYNEFFKDFDSQLNFVTSKKTLMYSSVLFDRIYTSEVLDTIIIGEIQKIREGIEEYKWYDRSVIISALSLSLIHFKFDQKKANLLLDFVTDFESNVWQRALTGLTIAILYHSGINRSWMRATVFLNRLTTLRNNPEIQNALKAIDFILRNQLYKSNLYSPKIFEHELFKNPMSCFVPFYENNEVLNTAIDNAHSNFDVEEFKKNILEVPLMDCFKYAICANLDSNDSSKSKLTKDSASLINASLSLSNQFEPFQNLISEFYNFYKYFPGNKIDDVFTKEYYLVKTPLKEYILSTIMKLSLDAITLYNEKKYKEAISKYNELLNIDKYNVDARWQLANCYAADKNSQEALRTYLKLENSEKPNKILISTIADCYNDLKQYEKSNEYCKKLEAIKKPLNFSDLYIMADNYHELGDHESTFKICQRAEKEITDEEDMVALSVMYDAAEKPNEALRLINKVLESKNDVPKYWKIQGEAYLNLFDWVSAKASIKKSLASGKMDNHTKMILGRIHLFSKTNIEEAESIFRKILNKKSDIENVTYGNLGHFYFINGNEEEAIKYYLKCIKLLNSVEEFKRKMKIDLKFFIKLGITEKEYYSLRDKVIDIYLQE